MKATRASLDKPTGMIITDLVGDDRIQKKFKEENVHPAEFGGMPTGVVAVKTGVVTEQTNSALLLAQAGQRIAKAVENMQRIEKDAGKKLNPEEYGFVDVNSDVYKRSVDFANKDINSDNETKQRLGKMQLVALQAQAHVSALITRANSPGAKAGDDFFKAAHLDAADYMTVAKGALTEAVTTMRGQTPRNAEEGHVHEDIARKLSDVRSSLTQPQVAMAAAQRKTLKQAPAAPGHR